MLSWPCERAWLTLSGSCSREGAGEGSLEAEAAGPLAFFGGRGSGAGLSLRDLNISSVCASSACCVESCAGNGHAGASKAFLSSARWLPCLAWCLVPGASGGVHVEVSTTLAKTPHHMAE